MVTTFQTKPALVLQPYISCYALRTFDTGKFILPRPMYAVPEYYITFFLKDRYCIMEYTDGSRGKFSNSITGFLSKNIGCTYYQGSYHILCVQIKANGLFIIFGIPQRLIQNTVLDLEDLLGKDSISLAKQCEECDSVIKMAKILDAYFIKKLLARKISVNTMALNALANELFMKKGLVSIDNLKSKSNMSFRTFERQFHEQVGMSPKLFARVSRFFYAIEDKMFHPQKSWTDITYQYQYYDQSHFIKDVIYFSGKSPKELFLSTPPPTENYLDIN